MPVSGIPLISGPQDPSQLDNLLNSIILAANGAITGSSPTGVAINNGSTLANLPTFGVVTLGTTVGSAAYTLAKPTNAQIGQMLTLCLASTKGATVAGNFFSNKTKLTFASTGALATVQRMPAVQLTAVSTGASAWRETAMVGSVKST